MSLQLVIFVGLTLIWANSAVSQEIGPDLANSRRLPPERISSSSLSSIPLQSFESKLPDSNPVLPCSSLKCIERLDLDDDKSLSRPAKPDVIDKQQADKKAAAAATIPISPASSPLRKFSDSNICILSFKCAETLNSNDEKNTADPIKRDVAHDQERDKKPRPRFYRDKAFVATSLLVYAAAGFDMHETMRQKWLYSYRYPPLVLGTERFTDRDVLARPIVNLPNPAYLATGFAMATGLNWISWKMKNSHRFRHIWRLPQTAAIVLNTRGGLTCELNANDFIHQTKQKFGWKTFPPTIPVTKH